ncbi:hypothetical protein COU58_01035 [Candidatus Pacearchaeota archaeon CG10_big_fil_rev_8_21_14_0_10_32_42]|nr:MAG: hypothetical protein COU58_01035 [Candidatus Pacearchaeota archaeon CG10_big_fil_rev_8_21_14_0_10_32_42]
MGKGIESFDPRELKQLIKDVTLIKNILISEGELSNWARKELDETRKTPREEFISMKEIEKEFL